jgi:hypothetical protein
MKKYKIKVDKNLLKKLKPYWKKLILMECEFIGRVSELEDEMSREFGIKYMEFFRSDNDYVGIGNADRTMRLIQREELESGKLKKE